MCKIEQRTINKIMRIIESRQPGVVIIKGVKVRIDPVQQLITTAPGTHSGTHSGTQTSITDEKTGGILPLLTLIPLIAGAVGAAGAAAGGVATAVKAANDKTHQKEMERIAAEKGVTIKAGEGISEAPPTTAEIINSILTLHRAGFTIMRV